MDNCCGILSEGLDILEALPLGVLVVGDTGEIRAINSAAAALLGLDETISGQHESRVTKQELIAQLDGNHRDDWSRLLGCLVETADTGRWHRITSARGPVSVRVTPGQAGDGPGSHVIVMLDPTTVSSTIVPKTHDRTLLHEMNNCLAVATTNAELIGINVDRKDYSRLTQSARLISDNLFRLADLFQSFVGNPTSR
jgi:PAS domain-containing protein